MNIAHLLPYSAAFPLKKHNGRYDWAMRLAEYQAQSGHSVTIYAGPSTSDSNAHGVQFRTLPENLGDKARNNAALFALAGSNARYDILHSHFDSLHYELADTIDKPIVATQHWFPTAEIGRAAVLNTHRNAVAVPVTHYMAAADTALGIPAAEVIYHGIDLRSFALNTGPRTDRLLFVGRIAPHKGVLEAVQTARSAGVALDIVGKVNPADQAYWQQILPMVDGASVRYLGAVPHEAVPALMARAAALLFLPNGMEAFGQTIIEAQACGTPVILNDIGANSELAESGISGFVCTDPSQVAGAIKQAGQLDPRACRKFAEKFDITDMVDSYSRLYGKLI